MNTLLAGPSHTLHFSRLLFVARVGGDNFLVGGQARRHTESGVVHPSINKSALAGSSDAISHHDIQPNPSPASAMAERYRRCSPVRWAAGSGGFNGDVGHDSVQDSDGGLAVVVMSSADSVEKPSIVYIG